MNKKKSINIIDKSEYPKFKTILPYIYKFSLVDTSLQYFYVFIK